MATAAAGAAPAGTVTATTESTETRGEAAAPTGRDRFVDFTRAFSLLVVIVWHWGFTVLVLTPGGPQASNPIGTTSGMWMLTWLLQVMPLFFFVGGYAHLLVWRKVRAQGGGYRTFLVGRLRRLLGPVAVFLGILAFVSIAIRLVFPAWSEWADSGLWLIASPLWFIAVYVVLVFLAPLAARAHDRFGVLCVVWLVGAAALVDVFRFHDNVPALGLVNLVIVWGCCHQLGFFYDRLVAMPRQMHWVLFWSGLFALMALTNTGLYPRSMVGVPGENISNMAPPTLCILALCVFQIGVAMLVRPWVLRKLDEPRWQRSSDAANRFSMPLFLWHTTGFAIAFGVLWVLGVHPPQEASLQWWLLRPLYLIVPLLVTLPIVLISGKRWTGRQKAKPAHRRPVVTGDVPGRW